MKILVADDHRVFSNAIAKTLKTYASVILEANNTKELFSILENVVFDLLLLDYDFPSLEGISTVKQVKEIAPHIKILSVSSHIDQNIIKNLLDAGVNGYFCKDSEFTKLIEAMKSIMSGNIYLDEKALHILNSNYKNDKGVFSDKELEVLKLKSEGFASKEIADQLSVTTSTVEYHCKNMVEKANCKNTNQLIRLATLNKWI